MATPSLLCSSSTAATPSLIPCSAASSGGGCLLRRPTEVESGGSSNEQQNVKALLWNQVESLERTGGGGGGNMALVNRESGEHDITNPTHQGRAKKRTASVLNSTNDIIKEGNPEYNLDEPTMEEKLASMNLLNKCKFTKEQPPSMAPPSADSVHILLKQALRADDHAELLKCLYNRDEKVIVKSISLLTPADVVKLLKFFVLQMQSRGATLVCLLPWLQTLLNQHMSSIVSQKSSLVLLNSLYQLVDARTSTFKSALQLSTTLDYLFSEIADDETDEEEAAPPIIYEDKDTDEEESEVDVMETDGQSE